ncbi:hypothetical protein GF108_05320 [Phyllobacterium sp. SYP-B3895]|uniref:hypothetical protein n=1 Tax=Phyllobacterium sp. SYP-B3895 TaxID=2663240 RepID=UPI0012999B96|nr:hypothetical protein [Phyllobacterium sp. SYP-B3895]MRG55004.1 hypothetical protein [Phyllobacterium sp. SYP-B3895]
MSTNGRDEPRWIPALAILAVLGLLAVLPHHVHVMPVWVSYVVVLVVLVPMAAVTLTGSAFWVKAERIAIMLLAAVYAANTAAELADMIGIITIHPPETRAVSLLSSSLAIWVTNVLTFSLLYWQIDRGGPGARVSSASTKPDWLFPQATAPDLAPTDWRPLFLDYLFLGFNTATAFSPTDVLPLTRRAKSLMMVESTISLLTLVIVAARAINVLP